MWKVYLIMLLCAGIISYLWVNAIDNMMKNHPDYKGDDFLNWGEKELKDKTETHEWDDNQVHTEGGFH